MDAGNTMHFFQNDYQVINHSPHDVCNVTLSATLSNPQNTTVANSYNARLANSSTHKQGIDIFAPEGDQHTIPANGALNLGFTLMQQVEQAVGNTTTSMAGGSLFGGALPTVETAQYCDEMQQGTQGMQGNTTTGGGAQGMQGNTTTGMQGNTTTTPTTTTTSPAAENTTAAGTGGETHKPKKFKLRGL